MSRQSPIVAASRERYPSIKFGNIGNMEIAVSGDFQPGKTFLADLSAIRKRLVVGQAAVAWLREHTHDCPEQIFETRALAEGAILVRIHRDQYVLIDGPATERYDELFTLPTGRHGEVLLLEYECADIVLAGPQVANIMSELCPMPMHEIPNGVWCTTRMAHADVAILPIDSPNRHYRIIVTPADANFLYKIFSDAVAEYDGRQIGFNNYWQDYLTVPT